MLFQAEGLAGVDGYDLVGAVAEEESPVHGRDPRLAQGKKGAVEICGALHVKSPNS
jgi:hypothetical protein